MATYNYVVQIGFSASQMDGLFVIGSSKLDSLDALGYEFNINFTGPEDDVTNVAKKFHVRRGRPNKLAQIQSGNSDIDLLNKLYKYTPTNGASPLAGDIVPMRPVRIAVSKNDFGGDIPVIDFDLFQGFIAEVQDRPDWGDKEVTITSEDLFIWLNRMDGPVIANTGPTTTGAAIGMILDKIGWTDPLRRNLDTGSSIPNFSADGSKKALALIDDLLTADRGVFFISKFGVATYRDRNAEDKGGSLFTLTDLAFASPGITIRDVYNQARVTREGGVPQSYVDTASKNTYGLADAGEIETPYLNTDVDAFYLAKWLVSQQKDPKPLFWELEITEAHTSFDNLLGAELFDRFTISSLVPGMSGEYVIQQIEHWGEGGVLFKSKWTITRRTSADAFVIGSSTLNSTDAFVF